MALRQGGVGGRAAGSAAGGGGLSILYAGSMVETTLSGAHAAGATTVTLASVAGFRDDMTLGIDVPGTGYEAHSIESVDEATNSIEIPAPGLAMAYGDIGIAAFAAPMFGALDSLDLPGGPYTELDARYLFDLPQLNGNAPFYKGRSNGAYYAPHASWFETITDNLYWFGGGNTEPGLASYSIGVIHATAAIANLWSLDYELATGRLIFIPANPALAVSFHPRIYRLIVAGRT